MLRKIHLLIGTVGLILFALQGQYMDLVHNHLADMADRPRMLYRSSHIYFLLASVMNLILGVYLPNENHLMKAAVQGAVSAVVILAPVALMVGFFVEPEMGDLLRPYTRPALYALFGAGVVLSVSGILNIRR